jgi:hypothetical protein
MLDTHDYEVQVDLVVVIAALTDSVILRFFGESKQITDGLLDLEKLNGYLIYFSPG